MHNLLDGLRVVDTTSIVMGPMASQTMADLGAEVIKVEPPEGDLARASGTPGPDGMGALFANNNRNKRSLALDLKRPDCRAALERLLAGADIVLINMRPKAAARLGLNADTLCARYPRLIHCAATGFGADGPYGGRAAYDDIIQAAAGLAGLAGRVSGVPAYVPSIMADKIGALHVVHAVLAAVIHRQTTGKGMAIEVPMFETLAAFLMNEHLDAATFDASAAPGYARVLTPHRRPYATADGWLAVMPYTRPHWAVMLALIGREAVVSEAWFADAGERNRRAASLYALLAEALPQRTTAEWATALAATDIPHAAVPEFDAVLDDPHLAAQGFFAPSDGLAGRVRSVPQPVRFAGAGQRADLPPPTLNRDGAAILAGLGYDPDEIARLLAGAPGDAAG